MSTTADIIQAAFRELNLIAAGATPKDAELTEGLGVLQRYVASVLGYEVGENLADWIVPAPQRTSPVASQFPQLPAQNLYSLGAPIGSDGVPVYAWPYPPANCRLVFGGVTGTHVYFPESPSPGAVMAVVQGSGAGDGGVDGATLILDGNGRFIDGAATVTLTSPITVQRWLYRDDIATWVTITPLIAANAFPFPDDFDDCFVCAMALRLAPRYDKVVSMFTQQAGKTAMSRLKARYKQKQVTVYNGDQLPPTGQSFATSGNGWQIG